MRSLLLLVLLAASAFVAGCGDARSDSTPAGSGLITEARLGVKIYPGAVVITSGENDKMVTANILTTDPLDKVVAFYEAELGVRATGDGVTYQIYGEKGGRQYAIALKNNGKTLFSILGKK